MGITQKLAPYLYFVCALIFSVSLILPVIHSNIDTPNMITYFNADEGGQMDLIWFYYSGEKRPSFQWDFDYGLEMVYLADFSRLILSNFIRFTPGTFVLILRWLNLLGWILSCYAIIRLVGRHFGNKWYFLLIVPLLSVRPALASLSKNMKPEPVVLFFTIIGLDYALRIIDNPFKKRNLYMAAASAAVAFLIKYAGIFIFPVIVAAMYFAVRYQRNLNRDRIVFPEFKIAWILPSLVGLLVISLSVFAVYFYARKATGMSWYEQYGFWGSVVKNKAILYMCAAGLGLIILSAAILFLNRSNNFFVKKMLSWINEINSYALVACGIFFGFVFLFGFKFLLVPKYFLNIYAQLGPVSLTTLRGAAHAGGAFSLLFLRNIADRIKSSDAIVFICFIFYVVSEIYFFRKNYKMGALRFFKRLTLLVFLAFPFMVMFSLLKIEEHHMLPFFAVMSILVIQGIDMVAGALSAKKMTKNFIVILAVTVLILDIALNSGKTIQLRREQFLYREDISFQIKDWWLKNIPLSAKIVAEHHNHVYIPEGYDNIEVLSWNGKNKVVQLRKLVEAYRPEFVYYNEGSVPIDEEPMPPLTQILPDKNIELVKSFENSGRKNQRRPRARFVIYKVIN